MNRVALCLLLACLLLAWLTFSPAGAQEVEVDFSQVEDRRSYELVLRECRSELGRNQVTLFGNGTLRHRFGPEDELEMTLFELTEEEVQAYANRLAQLDLSETDRDSSISGGEWIDRCVITFGLPGEEPDSYSYGPFDSLSLDLSKVVAIADELEKIAREESSRSRLPVDYYPEPGDVLERFNGNRFRVISLTQLKRGVELVGVDQPVTLYVALDELPKEFVELLSRRERYR